MSNLESPFPYRSLSLSALLLLAGCASPGKIGGNPDLGRPFLGDLPGVTDDSAAPQGDAAVTSSDLVSANTDLSISPSDGAVASPDLVRSNLDAGSCTPQMTPCDPVCQNCMAGGKCVVDNTNKSGCVAPGMVKTGDVCATGGFDDCTTGNACIGVSQQQKLSICLPFCRADADCKNGGKCAISLTGITVKVCSEGITGCDAIAATGCPNGKGCFPVTSDGRTGCHLVGVGGQGTTCDSTYNCQAGHACIFMMGIATGKCSRVCSMANPVCSGGSTCQPIQSWPNSTGCCL